MPSDAEDSTEEFMNAIQRAYDEGEVVGRGVTLEVIRSLLVRVSELEATVAGTEDLSPGSH